MEIKQLDEYYKSPFIVTGFATGTHILSKEPIGVLSGDQSFMQLYLDPKSDKFLKPVTVYDGKPYLHLDFVEKKSYHLNGKPNYSHDIISSVMFDEHAGVIVVNFNGNFRMYEPISFKEVWYHEEMNMKDDAQRDKIITFVQTGFSKRFGFLVIGGIEGRLIMYDLASKTRIGMNQDIHRAEILNIYFNDEKAHMISVSVDTQISIWDTPMFECIRRINF